MSIAGPQVQFAVSEIFDFQYDEQGKISGVTMKQQAATFFTAIQQLSYAMTRNGPTSSRPTSSMPVRWLGMPYFDTSISSTVFLSATNPDVWITASTWVTA